MKRRLNWTYGYGYFKESNTKNKNPFGFLEEMVVNSSLRDRSRITAQGTLCLWDAKPSQ